MAAVADVSAVFMGSNWYREIEMLRVLGLFVLVLTGCTALRVSTDYDPDTDFSGLRSYDWLPAPVIKTGDPEVTYNSLIESRIRSSVNEILQARGYRLSTESPDFLLAYHVNIDNKESVTYINDLYGYDPGWGYRGGWVFPRTEVMVTEYKQGTLVLDIVRAGNRQLIWRGVASDDVYADDTPADKQEKIRAAVKEMLSQFPPQTKQKEK
jgi:hypothetical protein